MAIKEIYNVSNKGTEIAKDFAYLVFCIKSNVDCSQEIKRAQAWKGSNGRWLKATKFIHLKNGIG